MNNSTLTKLEYFSIKILAALASKQDLTSNSDAYAIGRAKYLIEELNNDIGNWISVEDQIPLDTDRLLMFTDNNNIYAGIGYEFNRRTSRKENDWEYIYTHWQLFPKPPKQ